MRLIINSILVCLILFSCSVSKEISNKTFKYKSKKRTLQLVFENDSICRLENIFYCNDIKSDIKELTTISTYKKNGDTIFLKNIACTTDNCHYDLIRDIPPQESKDCDFLNIEKRKRKMIIGPSYLTDYQKYGIVPNIDIDTLYIIGNKIFLNKQSKEMSISFIFK